VKAASFFKTALTSQTSFRN